MTDCFIRRVTLRNYKSIAACQVDLKNLMFLVGPNGAGKSSFLDSLKFVADCLSTSLDHALRDRGSIKDVRRRSGGHPTHFSIRLDFQIPGGPSGHYTFKVGTTTGGEVVVLDEECQVLSDENVLEPAFYRIREGKVETSSVSAPATIKDRLALVNYAGLPAFRPVYDALARIEIYNLNPKEIATPQKIVPLDQLRRDGSNAASILRQVSPEDLKLINDYLGKIVPGIGAVQTVQLGSFETMQFRQRVQGQRDAWGFLASSMSDGTLRSFGILLATLQRTDTGPLLIGLEEPETAIHPAAVKVLMKALREAANRRQVLVTSHSPDLLDDPDLDESSLLSVQSREGTTYIGPIDEASRSVLRESLFTPGELLRQDQIRISSEAFDPNLTKKQKQDPLFEIEGR
jgi:predicted ATPase